MISDIDISTDYILVAGTLLNVETVGMNRGKRLVAQLKDKTGFLELAWFQGISWLQKSLQPGKQYLVFGKVSFFQGQPQIVHPEMESFTQEKSEGRSFLEPIYSTTEKLRSKVLGGRQIGLLTAALIRLISERELPENLPKSIISRLKLISRYQSFLQIHFPANTNEY